MVLEICILEAILKTDFLTKTTSKLMWLITATTSKYFTKTKSKKYRGIIDVCKMLRAVLK